MSNNPVQVSFVARIIVDDGDGAIEFYRRVFGVSESDVHRYEDGRVANAELSVGGTHFSLTSATDDMNPSPTMLGGSPVIISVEHPNPDRLAAAFVEAGGEVVIPIADRPYGRRDGRLRDPFGHVWIPGRPL